MKNISTLISLSLLLIFSGVTANAVPKLSSYPSAPATIYLDFDGHYVNSGVWNMGYPFACAASGMDDSQVTEVFNRTAEDYRPFNINITTDSTVFLAAPLNKRIRIIVTPTSSWYPGVGGVSWINSFVWGDDTPAFVFCDRLGPNNPKLVAECCSHEAGHTVGLSHQSKYDGVNCGTPLETYNSGNGAGEPGWAPIMGNSYGRNMTNWNNGPTPYGCTSVQDNLSIISSQSSIGFRTDDFTAALNNTATALNPSSFSVPGVISTNTDKDAFKLVVSQNTGFHITAVPFNVGGNNEGANLDVKLELYNSTGTLLRTYDPEASMSVSIDTNLAAGTYYVLLDGTGNAFIGEYGSLGAYTLSGFSSALPVKAVTLTGNTLNGRHNLSWSVIADEPLQYVTVESSADGINFSAAATMNITATAFSWQPVQDLYYRIKTATANGRPVYSNIILLKQPADRYNKFSVSSFIQGVISVNAPEAYQYQVTGINGSILQAGKGVKGYNTIAAEQLPSGMYIIRLTGKTINQTERILKQ
ncbi:MAG: T9SS type A sorting domain-containing protein [Ferruginibacter sp.]